jgi:hypothetical protein
MTKRFLFCRAIMKFVHDRCELTVNVISYLCNLEVFRVRYGWDMAALDSRPGRLRSTEHKGNVFATRNIKRTSRLSNQS